METKCCFVSGSSCTAETAGRFVSRTASDPVVVDERGLHSERERRVHHDARVEVDQADRLPAELQRQHASGDVVERLQVVGLERPERGEGLESRDRALDFLIHGHRDRPRPLDVLGVDHVLLLLPGGVDEPPGEEPEGDDGEEEEEGEDGSEADPADRLP